MKKSFITAALILAIALSAAGCGTGNAGTSAYQWNGTQSQQELARGTEKQDGTYHADKNGQVDGYRTDGSTDHTENSLTKAGEDLTQGAKDAGESIGKAAEDTLDGLTGTQKTTTR